MRIKARARTNSRCSSAQSYNGIVGIDRVEILAVGDDAFCAESQMVYIDSVSVITGKLLRGGLVIDIDAMDQLATEWLEKRKEQREKGDGRVGKQEMLEEREA